MFTFAEQKSFDGLMGMTASSLRMVIEIETKMSACCCFTISNETKQIIPDSGHQSEKEGEGGIALI